MVKKSSKILQKKLLYIFFSKNSNLIFSNFLFHLTTPCITLKCLPLHFSDIFPQALCQATSNLFKHTFFTCSPCISLTHTHTHPLSRVMYKVKIFPFSTWQTDNKYKSLYWPIYDGWTWQTWSKLKPVVVSWLTGWPTMENRKTLPLCERMSEGNIRRNEKQKKKQKEIKLC